MEPETSHPTHLGRNKEEQEEEEEELGKS